MNILEIKNLSKSFENKKVLIKINLEINKGEIYGLLGKNASGKSTLINIIGGLIKKDEGEIIFNGKEISILRENPSFYPHLSLLDNYKIFSEIYGNKMSFEVLEEMGLKKFIKNKAKTLSQGTKQKLSLAINLWKEADLYIFDEPFEHIDPETKNFILRKIEEIKRNGKSFLITTHRKEDVELFDRVSILREGKISFCGSKEDKEVKEFFND